MSNKTRYYYCLRQKDRYETGWTFGVTPEEAALDACKDAGKFSRGPVQGAAAVTLRPDDGPWLLVRVEGTSTECRAQEQYCATLEELGVRI